MSASNKIRQIIDTLPENEPFSSNRFRHFASPDNIKKILSRLATQGKIIRVARGIYSKPQKINQIGLIPPSIREIIETLTQSTGETIIPHGAEAARQLGLTTQVPMRLIFYTNGNSRAIKIQNRIVELKHINPSKLIAAGTVVGITISALIYLGKNNVKTTTIHKLKKQLSSDDFNRLLDEIERMPSWLAEIFHRYQKEQNHD